MGNTSVYKFTYLNNNDYLSSQIDKNRFQSDLFLGIFLLSLDIFFLSKGIYEKGIES